METRRTVATDTGCEVVLVSVVVLTLGEETFEGVLRGIRIQVLILSSVVELRIGNVGELGHVTVHILVMVLLVLMTEEDMHVVQSTKGVVPVDQLVDVQCAGAVPFLLTTSVDVLGITTDRCGEFSIVRVEHVVSHIGSELEVVQEGPLKVATRADVVTLCLADAGLSGCIGVLLRGVRTDVLGTPVILALTLLVEPEVAIIIIQIDRIDRGDALCEHKDVRIVGLLATEGLIVGVSIGDVTADADVLADVLVNFHTAVVTLEARTNHVTFILQITQRGESLRGLRTAVEVHAIFLTAAVLKRILGPVVIPLLLSGVGIQLAGKRVDQLVVGNTLESVVLQVAVDQVLGSVKAGTTVTHLLNEAVTIGLVHHLIVLTSIGNDVVVGYATGVETIAGIEVDVHLAGLTGLGGNHDHTVRTTCTVHRVGGSVLQDGQRLDILSGDGVQ